MDKDEPKFDMTQNYDMEADAQREISRMRKSKPASEASAKPAYKYEKLDRYAGYGIIFLSGSLLAGFIGALIYYWPV